MVDSVPPTAHRVNAGRTVNHTAPSSARITDRIALVFASAVILPPVLLWQAWKTSSDRYRHWLLTVFVTVYGSTIGIQFTGSREGADGVRHLYSVHTQYTEMSFGEFLSGVLNILTLTPGDHQQDLYIHALSYFVGGVLGQPGLFFTFVAFIYGFFFAGSLVIILRGWHAVRLPIITLMLAITFLLIKNIEGVNTVRTWTGLWVLVYACLKYHGTGRWRYVVLMACPPFIHIGWAIMVLPAFVVLLFGARPVIYTVLFFSSSMLTTLPTAGLEAQFNRTEVGARLFRAYQRDEAVDRVAATSAVLQTGSGETRIWRALRNTGLQKLGLNIFVFTLVASGVYFLSMSSFQQRIFSIGLLMITLSNSMWFISALSNRVWIAGAVFIGAAFITWRLGQGSGLRVPLVRSLYAPGLALSMIVLFPYLLFNMSTFLDFPSVFMLGLPFVVWLDPGLNITLKEALRVVVLLFI